MCGCLSCTPYWRPGPQPQHVPSLGIKPATFILRLALNPLSHTSQGQLILLNTYKQRKWSSIYPVVSIEMFGEQNSRWEEVSLDKNILDSEWKKNNTRNIHNFTTCNEFMDLSIKYQRLTVNIRKEKKTTRHAILLKNTPPLLYSLAKELNLNLTEPLDPNSILKGMEEYFKWYHGDAIIKILTMGDCTDSSSVSSINILQE